MNEYKLLTLPEPISHRRPIKNGPLPLENEDAFIWSGPKPQPPAIGEKVNVRVHSIGPGHVVSYFYEQGERAHFVGVCVKLDNPPDWHAKQNKGNWHEGHALVFGNEIEVQD